jgi:hypothetical protein
MTKVSPFLRQEMAGSVGLIAEAVIRFATSSKNWHAVWALAVLLRGSLTIVGVRSGRTGQSSPDIPRRDMAFQPSRRTPSLMNLLDPIVDVMH